jgi:hypothetical protein
VLSQRLDDGMIAECIRITNMDPSEACMKGAAGLVPQLGYACRTSVEVNRNSSGRRFGIGDRYERERRLFVEGHAAFVGWRRPLVDEGQRQELGRCATRKQTLAEEACVVLDRHLGRALLHVVGACGDDRSHPDTRASEAAIHLDRIAVHPYIAQRLLLQLLGAMPSDPDAQSAVSLLCLGGWCVVKERPIRPEDRPNRTL